MDWKEITAILDNQHRWETIFGLFSMERVEPFMDLMGFEVSNKKIFRKISRKYYDKHLKWENERTPIDDWNDWKFELFEEAGKNYQEILMGALSEIAKEYGEKKANYFEWWGENYFPYWEKDDYQEQNWDIILRELKIQVTENKITIHTLSVDKIKAIVQLFNDHIDYVRKIDKQLAVLEGKRRTKWERKIFKTLYYDTDISPLWGLSSAIWFHQFHITWNNLYNMLSIDDRLNLFGWVNTSGGELGNPFMDLKFPPREKYLKLLEFKEGVE